MLLLYSPTAVLRLRVQIHRLPSNKLPEMNRRGLNTEATRMWANAQPDGRPAEHRWRPLFNAAKFG